MKLLSICIQNPPYYNSNYVNYILYKVVLHAATCAAIIKWFPIKNVSFQSFTYLHAYIQVLSFTQGN